MGQDWRVKEDFTKQGVQCDLDPSIQLFVKSASPSVTRWLYYFFNISPFASLKISPIRSVFCQIRNKLSKFCHTLENFRQSGEFLPNLVTLVSPHKWIISKRKKHFYGDLLRVWASSYEWLKVCMGLYHALSTSSSSTLHLAHNTKSQWARF